MRQVTIRNFQSHKETRIELSDTVNSFEGASDSGKSAILRAMLWALTNRPDGKAFASYWAKRGNGEIKDAVSVSVDNITRERSDNFNGYIRYGAQGTEQYEALKGAVPVEMERSINIGDVNIQRQMDPPFLISSTSGDAARYLNSLVGLEEIDVYQKALKGKSRDNANSLNDETARLAGLEKELQGYSWVDSAKDAVGRLDKVCRNIASLESDLSALSALDTLPDASALRARLAAAEHRIAAYPDTGALSSDLALLGRVPEVADIAHYVEHLSASVQAAGPLIDRLSTIDCSALEQAYNALSTALSELALLDGRLARENGRIGAVNALIARGGECPARVQDLSTAIRLISEAEAISDTLCRMTHDLAEVSAGLTGKTCPICGHLL